MIKALDILNAVGGPIDAKRTKIHLASSGENDSMDLLDIYHEGRFDEWQRWQNRRNFERDFVMSLIKMPGDHRWLFAGMFRSHGYDEIHKDEKTLFYYNLEELTEYSPLSGRLVVRFERPSRSPYLYAEKYINEIEVEELLLKRLSIPDFPGFRHVDLTFSQLQLIIRHAPDSWRIALSKIAGVYLISDHKSGMLYVGSATGIGGLWQRWCDYAKDGHGDTKELKALLKEAGGFDRTQSFRFSILEIADIHNSNKELESRETHWKKTLLSRSPHGLNHN
ncbi:MAG: GIY-YIG nuclease family protein [Alphaproteobacteria bacterium]|nr:GIY-YIG nuclease family protein [Alphaproteobacteria bacterium]MBP7758561.1 GIY-YIG nuclease family protein [Alphaproteobacteria bacterium]MBP7761993.1 GIY-YIG nuclease family protein [Alphaproteobacteria bacterium]MBP7904105.1 GIY-YIG nuclease family protein [Alphaproteobacteria bacterium]